MSDPMGPRRVQLGPAVCALDLTDSMLRDGDRITVVM